MKKHYCVYKITNITNDKIYIGAHETYDLMDSYMGSGKNIKRALKKYGVANFKKEILFTLTSREEMYLKEAELVTWEFIERKDTYNITLGGHGGFARITALCIKEQKGIHDPEFRKNFNETNPGNFKNNKALRDKAVEMSHSPESNIKRASTALKNKRSAQFRVWVNNGVENKFCLATEADEYLSLGYTIGKMAQPRVCCLSCKKEFGVSGGYKNHYEKCIK